MKETLLPKNGFPLKLSCDDRIEKDLFGRHCYFLASCYLTINFFDAQCLKKKQRHFFHFLTLQKPDMHLCSNKDDIQVVQVGIDKIIFYGRYTITIVVLKIQIPFLFLLDLCLIQSTFLKKKIPNIIYLYISRC